VAIYRCEFKIISRGAGHRACAAAAYRAGEKIMDEHYGAAHDYTRKTGVAASFILAPDNAPAWMSNRAELWNAVEAVERRKDAQLCREVLLSLPHELTDDQREALVRQFVRDQFVSKGMVADVNIHTHSPSGDERNDHAHILLTTRTLTASSFGPKERSWNSRDFVHDTREAWADAQNRTFEVLGLDLRVDHRSLADQGIEREPEPKLGQHATEAIRNGEPEKADRVVQQHETVMERNAERERLTNERDVIDLALARLEKAKGERDQAEFAGLAIVHAQQMRGLQAAQAASLLALRREQLATLRAAVRAARADHDLFRKELTPSFLKRMGEIVMLKGREMRQQRDSALREFKSTQDSRLNALRARQRRELAALKDHHAAELARLRKGQGSERDDLALLQQQRFEREQALLQSRQAGGGSSSPRSADEVLFGRSQEASPALSPKTPPEDASEAPRAPRDGLSGVWDSHALPGGSTGASSGTETGEGDGRSESGTGSAGGGVVPDKKPREDEEAKPPAPPETLDAPSGAPEPVLDPEDTLVPPTPDRAAGDVGARITPEADTPRKKTGMFAKRGKQDADKATRADDVLAPKSREQTGTEDVRGRIDDPRDKPDFRDTDYTPTKDDLDRAREMEKAIRVHKARQARKRAEERQRLARERGKDREGPGR
jgi:hypothetical protein